MKGRIIKSLFWDSRIDKQYTPKTAYFYLYLLTCRHIGLTPYFKIPSALIPVETGLNHSEVEKAKKELTDVRQVFFYDDWVFIVNADEHNSYKSSPKTKIAYDKELNSVPDTVSSFFDRVSIPYAYPMEATTLDDDSNPNTKKDDTLSIGYAYPMHTHNSSSNSNNNNLVNSFSKNNSNSDLPKKLNSANIQAELYRRCKELDIACVLEYKKDNCRFDAAILDSTEKLRVIVEVKNYAREYQQIRNPRQLDKYSQFGIPVIMLTNESEIDKTIAEIKQILSYGIVSEAKESPPEEVLLYQWNDIHGTKYKSGAAISANLKEWLKEYTLADILKGIEMVKLHKFWRDKMTPVIYLRRKNPQGERVDYIGEMLNLSVGRDFTNESAPTKYKKYDK